LGEFELENKNVIITTRRSIHWNNNKIRKIDENIEK